MVPYFVLHAKVYKKLLCVFQMTELLAEVEKLFVTFNWLSVLISISHPFWAFPSFFTLYVKTL